MRALPWFPFYCIDWFNSLRVRTMGPVARAFYLELLRTQWEQGSIPADVESICRILVMPTDPGQGDLDYPRIVKQVLQCFVPMGDGRLINPKLYHVRQEQEKLLRSRSAGAAATNSKRWANGERSSSDSVSDRTLTGDLDIDLKRNTDRKADPVETVEISRKLQKLSERKNLNAI